MQPGRDWTCIDQLRFGAGQSYVGEWLPEVFDYPFGEIARILNTSEDNMRLLVGRARRHVGQRRPRFEASRERRDEQALHGRARVARTILAWVRATVRFGVPARPRLLADTVPPNQ